MEDARPSAGGPRGASRRPGRLKRILLAAATAFLALNVWTGSPLLAVWLGSRVQGEESQPSMGAFAVVIVSLVIFSLVLYQLLKLTMRAYQEATGTTPTVRTHAAWLRSMRDERRDAASARSGITGAERAVVVMVVIVAVGFEVWFCLLLLLLGFADRRRGALTGRHPSRARLRFVGHAPVAQLERAAAF
jgi:predicted secreted protein